MVGNRKKHLMKVLAVTALICILSLFYALYNLYFSEVQLNFFVSFINALFTISGVLMVYSGFRHLYDLGAYRTYALVLYKFKKRFSMSSISRRDSYVEEKLSGVNNEDGKPAEKDEAKNKEKDYRYFAYRERIKDENTSLLFSTSVLLFFSSIVLSLFF